jgi:hypothetical protein
MSDIVREAFWTPWCVANLISQTPCRDGIESSRIRAANWKHPESGRKRLREMAKRYRALFHKDAYHYDHNRFYPTLSFKQFCKREMRRYEKL